MIEIFILVLGLCIGSFLTVVVYRVPRKISVITPMRSFCPQSDKKLTWWENIPVISYLILGGKSRYTKKAIPFRYPLIEMMTAAFAVATYFRFGLSPTALVIFCLVCSLIAITFIDLEFLIIPNVISFPGMTFGLLLGIAAQYTDWFQAPITESAFDSLLGFLIGGGFFYAVGTGYYLVTKRVGLGGGDIKLLAMTGAILGVNSVIPTILSGSMIGVVVGLLSMFIKGGNRHSEIPFGPWLSVGTVLYIYGGAELFPFLNP